MRSPIAVALVCLALRAVAAAEAPPPEPLRDPLVIEPVGSYGRVAVHEDALQARLAAGAFTVPRAGQTLVLPDGTVRTWTRAESDARGRIRHEALDGGYALYTFEAAHERIALLEARGHSAVYVNGVLRAGDPYRTGFVLLPIRLEAGSNWLLFHARRGGLEAVLRQPVSRATFNDADVTVPDLLVGEPGETWGAIVVINATTAPLPGLHILARLGDGTPAASPVPPLPPLSVRKAGFAIRGPIPAAAGTADLALELVETVDGVEVIHDETVIPLQVQETSDLHARTFRSRIDGSVQSYGVRPAGPLDADAPDPGIALSLHGAGVDARNQAGHYRRRPWCHVVAPTNRRPFGFDWEDWGRLDALEVLEHAGRRLRHDPRRIWLTGHSMGGHGTWNLGALMPDRFAALGPSAGWVSFWSYGGAARYDEHDPIESTLLRASAPSDTLRMRDNLAHHGIYVLHGARDATVPVEQARTMRRELAAFHTDFTYYERPGAGHWWGSECMDWPSMFDFLRRHARPAPDEVTGIAFTTVAPGVSARCHWATVEAQREAGRPSRIDLRLFGEGRRIEGTTANVQRLALDLAGGPLPPGEPVTLRLDGHDMPGLPWPERGALRVVRDAEGAWSPAGAPDPAAKGPHRSGRFKDAFTNRFVLVYGTGGAPAENAWAFEKARYDAETFWYRGNGSVALLSDAAFDPEADRDRNVILYGNADTNRAWSALLAGSPVQARSGTVEIGDRRLAGDDLGLLLVRPRPGSDVASVGAVAGTGVHGMRLTDRLPYFVSGVGYPDLLVVGPAIHTRGTAGIRAAGFFGNDWSVEGGEIVVRE